MQNKHIKIIFFGLLAAFALFNACEAIHNTYTINNSNCTRCRTCISACGYGAISIDSTSTGSHNGNGNGNSYDYKVVINPEKCVGCGECIKVCPSNAISLSESN